MKALLRSLPVVLLLACEQAPAGPPVAEHHAHLRSPRSAEAARLQAEVSGEPAPTALPIGAAELLSALDSAGIEQSLILSTAYLFGSPELEFEDEAAAVAAENDFIAAEAARAPQRLFAVCAVNPLRPYAIAELTRCAESGKFRALKLHLTNSDVDLRDPAHLATLRGLFEVIAEHRGMGAVVHLRTQRADYGAEDVRRFVDEVLVPVPGVPVQIAHAGGWGGFDAAADSAIGALIAAVTDGRLERSRLFVDLSATVFAPEAAGADTALAAQVRRANLRLATRIRELGTDRVLFATDWPSWPPVGTADARLALNIRLLRQALPLNEEELSAVFSNRGLLDAPPR